MSESHTVTVLYLTVLKRSNFMTHVTDKYVIILNFLRSLIFTLEEGSTDRLVRGPTGPRFSKFG